MSYFEIDDLDWNSFEEKYNILRTEMVEVPNTFRHICRLFVSKYDLDAWNVLKYDLDSWNKRRDNFTNVEINYYHINEQKKWNKLIFTN